MKMISKKYMNYEKKLNYFPHFMIIRPKPFENEIISKLWSYA